MHGSAQDSGGVDRRGMTRKTARKEESPLPSPRGGYVHGLCLQLLLGLLFALGMALGAPEVCSQVTSSQSVRGLLPCTAQQQQPQQQLPALPPTPQQQPPLNNHMISQVSHHSVPEPPPLWFKQALEVQSCLLCCGWQERSVFGDMPLPPPPLVCELWGEKRKGRGLAKVFLVASPWELFCFIFPSLPPENCQWDLLPYSTFLLYSVSLYPV